MEGDKILQITGLLFILISKCLCQLSVVADKTLIEKGGNVTLTCRVEDYVQGEVVFWDRIYDQEANSNKENVASNKALSTGFNSDSGVTRYSVHISAVDGVPNAYNFILKITGVLLEDTGDFCCRYLTNNEERIHVDVIEQVRTITMKLDDTDIVEGEELEMEAGDIRAVKCIVGGSNPVPQVTMTLHKQKDGPIVTDVTDQFTIESVVSYMDEAIGAKSLKRPSGTTTVENKALEITKMYGNKYLTCSGTLKEGATISPLTKQIYIKFQGTEPEIECNNVLVSYNGETKVKLQCTVLADPRPEKHYVIFYEHYGVNESTTLSAKNPEVGHYRYSLEEEEHGKYVMVVEIDRVFPQMFRDYKFSVANNFGSVDHVIRLDRDKTLEVYGSAAKDYISMSTLLAAALLSITATIL